MLNARVRSTAAGMTGLLLLLLASGCQRPMWAGGPNFWPFNRDRADLADFTTPSERVKQIDEFAAQAADKSPAEQQQIVQSLTTGLASELNPVIRERTMRALGAYPNLDAFNSLRAGLNDPESRVRIASCEALGRRGDPAAVGALAEALSSDTDIDVRLASAKALGETRSAAAKPALGLALEDPNPALQHRCVESLRNIAGQDYGNDVNVWIAYAKGETIGQQEQPSITQRLRRLF